MMNRVVKLINYCDLYPYMNYSTGIWGKGLGAGEVKGPTPNVTTKHKEKWNKKTKWLETPNKREKTRHVSFVIAFFVFFVSFSAISYVGKLGEAFICLCPRALRLIVSGGKQINTSRTDELPGNCPLRPELSLMLSSEAAKENTVGITVKTFSGDTFERTEVSGSFSNRGPCIKLFIFNRRPEWLFVYRSPPVTATPGRFPRPLLTPAG